MAAALLLLATGFPFAQAAPQTGEVPVPLATADITYLMADRAERTDTLTIRSLGAPKRSWGSGWALASQAWSWQVAAPEATSYECTLLVSGPIGTQLQLSSGLGASFLMLSEQGWQRATFEAPLYLPSGTSTIALTLGADAASTLELLSIELVPVAAAPGLRDRAAAARSKDDWFQRAKYGVGVVWGEWSYPPTGARKAWADKVRDFDVDAFVAAVADTGADYLLLATSWATYYIAAPLASVDAVLPGRTSERDLIGEIADRLHARGIRLVLYYHVGHGDPAWWAEQGFDEDDKTTFVDTWESIITEIGQRYGSRLDGWWFDDGIVYYPAPFERMATAARAGNPNRLVTWNNYIFPRLTEFQELAAGEGFASMRYDNSALIPLDEQDLYVGGECKGMFPHGYFIYGDGRTWAIDSPDWVIRPPVWNAATTETTIRTYMPRTFTLNILAYEDGSLGDVTRDTLAAVREAFEPPSVTCEVATWILRPDAGALVDVGLSVARSDGQDATADVDCTLLVATDDLLPAVPATFSAPSALALSPAVPSSPGRSYLVGVRAQDADGNVGLGACSVVVPARVTPSHVTRLLWEAVETEAAFVRDGAAPASHTAVLADEELP